MGKYDQDLEDRIARIRARANFVPMDKVETGQFYWFHVVGADDVCRMYQAIAVRLNGVLYLCRSLDPKDVNAIELPLDRTFGAIRMHPFVQKMAIAQMYERAGNDDMAYKTWQDAQDMLTPEQLAERRRVRAQKLDPYHRPEWVPKKVKIQIDAAFEAVGLDTRGRKIKAVEARIKAENEAEAEFDTETAKQKADAESYEPGASLFDRALAKIGLQRIKGD